jgi:hypothetical protein
LTYFFESKLRRIILEERRVTGHLELHPGTDLSSRRLLHNWVPLTLILSVQGDQKMNSIVYLVGLVVVVLAVLSFFGLR